MDGGKNVLIYAVSFFLTFGLYAYFATAYASEGEEIDAKSLFEYHCVTCHGTDGKGTRRGHELKVPDLSDADWQATKKDDEMMDAITNGKNKMPPWREKLKPEEIQALVEYVRKLAPKTES